MGNSKSVYSKVNMSFEYEDLKTNMINLCTSKHVYLVLYSDQYLVVSHKDKYYGINYRDFCLGKKNRFVEFKSGTDVSKIKCDYEETIKSMEIYMKQWSNDYQYRLCYLYQYIEKMIEYMMNQYSFNN